MYSRMSGLKWFLLSIITCGIYSLVMWFKMTEEHNRMADSVGQKKIMGFIPAFLLGFVTCGIFPIIWYFQFFGLMAKLNDAKNAGVSPSSSIIMFVISLIPIYSFIWMAGAHNKLADAYEAA